LIPGKNFKDFYRHINVRMGQPDEQLLFSYLQLNGPSSQAADIISNQDSMPSTESKKRDHKAIFNLRQLDKLIDSYSKEHYTSLLEK